MDIPGEGGGGGSFCDMPYPNRKYLFRGIRTMLIAYMYMNECKV